MRLGQRRRGFCSGALRHQIDSLTSSADPQRCIRLAQECAALRVLPEARRLHCRIKELRQCHGIVANSIILMYAKCGSLDEARQVFDAMEKRDIYSWTVMVNGLARNARSKEALDLFNDMLGQGLRPHSATFVAVLNACSRPAFIDQGRSLHRQLTQLGLEKNVVVATALLTMYSKCGRLDESVNMFNAMETRNLVSWNAMIAAYAEHGRGMEALQVLRKMQHEGLETNESTYLSLMRAYRDPSRLSSAIQVHQLVVQAGLEQDIVVATTLVDMYAKCCSLENAKAVFDKVRQPTMVTWNALISAYIQQGHSGEALCLFRKLQLSGLDIDVVTFINIFRACSVPYALKAGRTLHACAYESGLDNGFMLSSVIFNMYAKCGSLVEAEAVFERMKERDLVTWTTLIWSYTQYGYCRKALGAYRRMRAENLEPDKHTYVSVLDACTSLGALAEGREIHQQLGDRALEDTWLGTALVNMYGKSGKLSIARQVFDKIPKVSLSWNSMITAYCQHGHGEEALELFPVMQFEGFEPTSVTFISLLSACAQGGLLEQGHGYFVSMVADYGLAAGAEHFGCMVELLGKSGKLSDAGRLIRDMPYEPDAIAWTSFLGACRSHEDAALAKAAANIAMELEPGCGSSYVSVAMALSPKH